MNQMMTQIMQMSHEIRRAIVNNLRPDHRDHSRPERPDSTTFDGGIRSHARLERHGRGARASGRSDVQD